MELLEQRVLLNATAPPRVIAVIADNRGEVIFTVDQKLDPATVNTRSVFMHTTGPDGIFGTADDEKVTGRVRYFESNDRISFRTSNLPVNTTYSMKLNASRLRGADGQRLDGEFNGTSGIPSGDGIGGGDFLFIARKVVAEPVARFSTEFGAINVRLFASQTPKNVANFLAYANTAAWDGSFIHRGIPGFVLQGGGFIVNKQKVVDFATEYAPVDNEPGITSNTFGTIALARPDDGNPATDDKGTNQWFFNLGDNSSNLDFQNGGFTAFGEITAQWGVNTLLALADFATITCGGVFSDLPVKESGLTCDQVSADPENLLIMIRRVAILNRILPFWS